MNRFQFEIPFPPSVNGYWRAFKGRQIISKRGREYREKVIDCMKDAMLYGEKIDSRLSVHIRMHPPCRRKRDVDNYTKAPLDALSHAKFWLDDSQIDLLTIKRAEKVEGGKLVITVKEIEDGND